MNLQMIKLLIAQIDWSDISTFGSSAASLLTEAVREGGTELFAALSSEVLSTPDLLDMAESNPTLTRAVLYSCPSTGARLRYHQFASGSDARPHNHRWPFVSFILRGGYGHTVYENNGQNLTPIMAYEIEAGQTYAMSHHCYHRTVVQENCSSLILQGPPISESWLRVRESHVEEHPAGNAEGKKKKLLRTDVIAFLDELSSDIVAYNEAQR